MRVMSREKYAVSAAILLPLRPRRELQAARGHEPRPPADQRRRGLRRGREDRRRRHHGRARRPSRTWRTRSSRAASVTFDDLKVAHVFSPVNGRVTEIYAQLGQHVKKGQPLAAIQSPDIGQAVADVHKAEADLTAANNDFKRQKDLEKQHAAATRDVEASEDRFRQAKAELERAQAKARLLRTGSVDAVTQTYTLASQIDGEVMMRAVNPGRRSRASTPAAPPSSSSPSARSTTCGRSATSTRSTSRA